MAETIPMPDTAQLLYPTREQAAAVAVEMGLVEEIPDDPSDVTHSHSLDGETWYMPGADHAQFEEATETEGPVTSELDGGDIEPGDTFRDVLNNDIVAVTSRDENGVLSVTTDSGIGWDEHADTLAGKVDRGTMESLSISAAEFAGYDGFDACVADNGDKDDPEAYCASIMREVKGEATTSKAAVDTKAEFSEGAAVRWTWDSTPVHGRVAEVRPEQATVSGNTITGDDGEAVYVIDEYDDRVEALRRENVAKPESSLNASGKDIPSRSEGNYVSSEAWDSLVTTVSQSRFTPTELDRLAGSFPDILHRGRPGEWILHDDDPAVYEADIPEKYLDGRSEEMSVPNAGAAEAARRVDNWKAEHGDSVAGGASDGEGARRGTQLVEYHDRDEPLAIEYWKEIANYHNRTRAQGNHELDSEHEGEPWRDAGYVSTLNWGGDPGYEQAQRIMDVVESVDQEMRIEMKGAVATEQTLTRDTLTEGDSNRVDLDALEGELRDAVEAEDFYVYGKASIEQWDTDDPPTLIQMEALEGALNRFFESETAPGIISRHHQDIPVGVPVREFEFEEDTTLDIGGETHEFEAGEVARSHVEDSDGDGRPELWLAANISGDNEMGKKTRVLAAQGDLDGFSVTVHRNDDEMTQEGRVVTDVDLHAVTIGTDDQIKNPGSEFDVAGFKSRVRQFADRMTELITR